MSAARLREAAEAMRANAEKAERGRWKLWGMQVMADPKGTSDMDDAIPVAVTYTPSWCDAGSVRTWNATHIASWHPAVALAVADWLDLQAEVERRLGGPDYQTPPDHPALAVANTYLGSAS